MLTSTIFSIQIRNMFVTQNNLYLCDTLASNTWLGLCLCFVCCFRIFWAHLLGCTFGQNAYFCVQIDPLHLLLLDVTTSLPLRSVSWLNKQEGSLNMCMQNTHVCGSSSGVHNSLNQCCKALWLCYGLGERWPWKGGGVGGLRGHRKHEVHSWSSRHVQPKMCIAWCGPKRQSHETTQDQARVVQKRELTREEETDRGVEERGEEKRGEELSTRAIWEGRVMVKERLIWVLEAAAYI